jgi:nicotinamide-nucleotide amidase
MTADVSADVRRLAQEMLELARSNDMGLIAAESCTAGLLGQALADAPGAAQFFHGTFVTYTKEQKTAGLGVSADLLQAKSAVCREVAVAMAEGALERSDAFVGVAITGVAGPEPDDDGNPVGRVCIAVAARIGLPRAFERNYGDLGRDAVRLRATADGLRLLIDTATNFAVWSELYESSA